jgi:hypothetical protein
MAAVEREDVHSGIELSSDSPNICAVSIFQETRASDVKEAPAAHAQQSNSNIVIDAQLLQFQRERFVGSFSHSRMISSTAVSNQSTLSCYKAFLQSEFLFNLGFATLDGFSRFHPIALNSKSWRSIVSLDKLHERETHKIGLIYVGRGHQTQKELFHNEKTSPHFEHFSQAVGWHVDLGGKHRGFMGGLDPLGSTGKFAPYFANSLAEVLFHVPTLMPTNKQDPQQVHKKRHVGNDHVHIILTEDDYDYRTSTIISQFNDVHIVVRENIHGLFSVRVHAKVMFPSVSVQSLHVDYPTFQLYFFTFYLYLNESSGINRLFWSSSGQHARATRGSTFSSPCNCSSSQPQGTTFRFLLFYHPVTASWIVGPTYSS